MKIHTDPLLKLLDMEEDDADLKDLDRRDAKALLEILKETLKKKIGNMKED